MSRAQKIREERLKFLWSDKNLEALSLYHCVLDLFDKVKFLVPFSRIVLRPHRGNTFLLIKGTVEKVTSIPYTQNNLADLIELFNAEDGYYAYWSDKEGNKDTSKSGTFVTVVMNES